MSFPGNNNVIRAIIGVDLTPCGYQGLDFSTAGVKTPTIPTNAIYMEIRIESSVVSGVVGRYLNLGATGTQPSSTVGMPVSHLDFLDVTGTDAVNNFRIIQTQAGTHTAHIQYYKK